jgi:hypothetical protein
MILQCSLVIPLRLPYSSYVWPMTLASILPTFCIIHLCLVSRKPSLLALLMRDTLYVALLLVTHMSTYYVLSLLSIITSETTLATALCTILHLVYYLEQIEIAHGLGSPAIAADLISTHADPISSLSTHNYHLLAHSLFPLRCPNPPNLPTLPPRQQTIS